VSYRRERWELPDGDFIDVDWVDGPASTPLLVLFHGLEGSSGSHYARTIMAAVKSRGWRGAVAHFRGCSGEPNRLPRAYYAGDTKEIAYLLDRFKAGNGDAPLFAAGVSLGGNALLKWLGEEGENAQLTRAAAISAPVDMVAAGTALDRGFTRNYTAHFLRSLKRKSLAKLDAYPLLYERRTVEKIDTIKGFDTEVTARLHGFRDAADYWTKASAKPGLIDIRVPTLMINARNDPFLPAGVLPGRDEVSDRVTLEYPAKGGHVGFVSGPFPGNLDWLPRRLLDFFGEGSAATAAAP
jgi:uncharacterized protein